MRNIFTNGAAVLAAIVVPSLVHADECGEGSVELEGNFYCQPVKSIQYTNFGGTGSYNMITDMDSSTGSCSSTPYEYSGSMAPLNGEVSVHVRGPAIISNFVAYIPNASSSKAKRTTPKVKHTPHSRRHGHAQFHQHNKEVRDIQNNVDAGKVKRSPEMWVTAVIEGKAVSWIWSEEATAAATPTAEPVVASSAAVVIAGTTSAVSPSSTTEAASSPAATSVSVSGGSSSDGGSTGDWTQVAYYEASSGTATGLTFLNNYGGGAASGTFDYVFGNSLSYANQAGTGGASSPTVLDDCMIESNKEVIIMTDTSCDDESGCGYYRPGTTAYHGFGGSQKIFIFEFSMPDDGTSGYNMNMPGIWLLNAQIPRTLQYGSADCSCWTSGCGEFDIFEVLDSGSTRAKSTLHGAQGAGDSDYFERPLNGTIKVSVVMNEETATIKILSNDFPISGTLSEQTVRELSSATWTNIDDGLGVSLFELSA